MVKKIIKFLSSLRFTIVLIVLLSVMFAIGLCVPQIRLVKDLYLEWHKNNPALVDFLDMLGLTTIYTSPITVTLWVFFFTNLSLVLWQRMPVIRKKISMDGVKIGEPEKAGAGYPFQRSYPLPAGMGDAQVLDALRKQRYTLLGDARGFYGIRNRYAPIAFAFFHLSFFLILLGGLVSVYTQFTGYVDLAEGETFQGDLTSYIAKPRPQLPALGDIPRADFTVKSIVPQVVRNTPTGISVKLADREGQLHEVGINVPYETEHTSFVFKHLGMAPLFVLKDASGREIPGNAYRKLDVLLAHQDGFTMDGLRFDLKFYPNYVKVDGKHATLTQEFKNPTFVVTVSRNGQNLSEGVLAKNGAMEFAGYRLELQDLLYWVRFYVVKQRGLSILYIGFALASVGVIWRLLFYRREIRGAIREEGGQRSLVVAARSEYYKSLAEDEFAKLFGKVLGIEQETEA